MICAELWTDGSGTTSGPGGWAFILRAIDMDTGEIVGELEESGGIEEATNNRAEITAVLQGLAHLKRPSVVEVFCDSEYVCNAVTKGWLRGWSANGWRKRTKDDSDGPILRCPTCGKTTPDLGLDVMCVFHEPAVKLEPSDDRRAVINRDLWQEMVQALTMHKVTFTHVRGHAGIELNEKCDAAAGAARRAIIEAREAVA